MATKRAVADPYAALPDPTAAQANDPYAALPDAGAPAAPTTLGALDYHPPGTEGSPKGSFADTVLRPVGNAGRSNIRALRDAALSIKDAAAATYESGGKNVGDYVKGQAHDLAHPIEAHRKAGEAMLARGEGGTRFDPKAPINYDRDVPELLGGLAAQAEMALATDGAMRGAGKVVGHATPGALKERARLLGRNMMGADKSLTRQAVGDAAERTARNDAHVATVNKDVEGVRTRRREAAGELDKATKNHEQQTQRIQAQARKQNDANYAVVREKVGDKQADLSKVSETIKAQENKMDPGSQAIFRQIVHEGSSTEDIARIRADVIGNAGLSSQPYEEMPPKLRETIDSVVSSRAAIGGLDEDRLGSVPFNRLQGFYTELGRKQFGGGQLPGNVYKAIDEVRGALRAQMDATAKEHGAFDDLTKARESNVKYQEAFGRQRNKPLSAADQELKNGNPEAYAQKQEQARRQKVAVHDPAYTQHAEALDKARDRLKSFPTEEALVNSIKSPRDATTVDIHQVALKQIERKAGQWKQFNKRDVGMLASSFMAEPFLASIGARSFGWAPLALTGAYEGGSRALAGFALKPGVADWFAKAPAGEIEALGRIPGADRVKIIDSYTSVGVEAAKQGKRISISAPVAKLLGEKNVRLIAAASATAASGKAVNNRREAMAKLKAAGAPIVP